MRKSQLLPAPDAAVQGCRLGSVNVHAQGACGWSSGLGEDPQIGKWISKAGQGYDAFQECRGDRWAVRLPLAGDGGHRGGIRAVERHWGG